MGNPLVTESPIRELILRLKEYEYIIESFSELDDKDKVFKIRETSRKINDLSHELDNIISCNEKNNFSITEEEKIFYMQRYLLLNIMANLI